MGSPFFWYGGEGGIRTLDTLLAYTPLAGERLRPLGHLSKTLLSNNADALCLKFFRY